MKLSSITGLAFSISLSACSVLSEDKDVDTNEQNLISLESYTHFDNQLLALVEQLVAVEQFQFKEKAVAFTTLVWMDSLTDKNNKGADHNLGHQLSSSLKTELVQRGGKVVEHKSAKAISMSSSASYYLTRRVEELSENLDVSYVLAGTLLEIKQGVEVNVEVIDVETHRVVSSARTFISNKYLPPKNTVMLKGNKIYREQL